MSPSAAQLQWYLARDGQQFGPLSDSELAKFVELGHLQPTDLLWREGFADWRPAMLVFPPRKPVAQRAAPPARQAPMAPQPAQVRAAREQAAAHQARGARAGHAAARPSPGQHAGYSQLQDAAPRGRGWRKALLTIACLAAVGAGGWYAFRDSATLRTLVETLPSRMPAGLFDMAGSKAGSDRRNIETSPLKGLGGPPDALDRTLQATPLWRIVKREFPDWYAERLKEIAALAAEQKDEATISQLVTRALVALRRQQVGSALAAGFPQLKVVASTFFENLVQLRKHSSEACFEFISLGEASPLIVSLLQNPAYTPYLQAQLVAVFEAIADGRKMRNAYPQPRKSDYDALGADLGKRGWSQADWQLFGDERALARAGPEKVCQLVHDWFAAQLGLKDPEVQLRLLVDSLKPVVAG